MFENNINPILFEWHFISVRFYGVFIAIGILAILLVLKKLLNNKKDFNTILDFIVWLIFGGLIGSRLGHVLFYNLDYFLANPKEIFLINHGGLSSHGLTIGLLITTLIYKYFKKIKIEKYLDKIIIPLPILIFFIRLANFTNSEIVGRPTDLTWGVKFPRFESNPIYRHPSQIYEALIAILIFVFLFFTNKKYSKNLPNLFIFHLFLFLYFTSRFLIEFTKEYQTLTPEISSLTMGQWLSLPFILWSLGYFVYLLKQRKNIIIK